MAFVVLTALALVSIDIWWLREFRAGYPLTVDEAGYLTIAFDYSAEFKSGGFPGLWDAFLRQGGIQAPLLPLVTVPILLSSGQEVMSSFLAVEAFFVLLIVASYGIGSRLANRSYGCLTAVVVASIPAVTEFTRQYHFAVPSAALYIAATYALLRSDGLSHRRWALAWGLALGLTTLARTVTLALVPGLLAAAALQIAILPRGRAERMLNFLLGVALAAATALLWYGPNYPSVFEYLTSYGYGEASHYFGTGRSIITFDFWTVRLVEAVNRGVHVPLAAILLVTLIGGGFRATGHLKRRGAVRKMVISGLQDDRGIVVLVVAAGYFALTSSRNEGTGFFLPLLPLVVVLALASLAAQPSRPLRALATGTFVIIAILNVGMNASVVPALSNPLLTDLMGFRVSLGIRTYMQDAGYDVGPSTARFPDVHRGWQVLDREVAAFIIELAAGRGRRPYVAFALAGPSIQHQLRRAHGAREPRLSDRVWAASIDHQRRQHCSLSQLLGLNRAEHPGDR
ncbi:MAG: glycosyltransferase family 39 protein [Gemmatimonadaceae bacterium]|nr:glycosyltransferase family 39 protein [Gemmatimonadaceae bacterium]